LFRRALVLQRIPITEGGGRRGDVVALLGILGLEHSRGGRGLAADAFDQMVGELEFGDQLGRNVGGVGAVLRIAGMDFLADDVSRDQLLADRAIGGDAGLAPSVWSEMASRLMTSLISRP